MLRPFEVSPVAITILGIPLKETTRDGLYSLLSTSKMSVDVNRVKVEQRGTEGMRRACQMTGCSTIKHRL